MQFTIEGELENTDEAHNAFYNRIQSLKKELEAENIPGTKKGSGQERSERMRSAARSKTELNGWRPYDPMGAHSIGGRTEGDQAASPALNTRLFIFSYAKWYVSHNMAKIIHQL